MSLFFKDDPQLSSMPVPPAKPFKPPLPGGMLGAMAKTYNRIGGLIDLLAAMTGIDPVAVLAVWFVESGGAVLTPGRPVLRFENHKFFQYWGSAHGAEFDRHFQFGGHAGVPGKPSKNHKFRVNAADPWRPCHVDSQPLEYAVFELARSLAGDEPACLSASFGGPQIMGFNHKACGYSSATALFEAFAAAERWHVLGFFDFCRGEGLLKHVVAHDWVAFGQSYNGNGPVYGPKLEAAYALKPQLEALPRRLAPARPSKIELAEDPSALGGVLKPGLADDPRVGRVVAGLARRGYRDADVSPALYDQRLKSLVMLFQAQNVDLLGRPLDVTGNVDPVTWSALVGAAPVTSGPSGVAGGALAQAISQVGVMEDPLGSNCGPKVDLYLASVGLDPGNFWCMAFVYWCYREAAANLGVSNPFPRTGGCLDAWYGTPAAKRLTRKAAIDDPSLVRSGMVFILDYGNGHGHTGCVKSSKGGALTTVEGNTSLDGSGNGVGVFELFRRSVSDTNLKGFIDFTRD